MLYKEKQGRTHDLDIFLGISQLKNAQCDNARPKCTPCTKSNCACYTVSMDGSEPISREYEQPYNFNFPTLI